MTIEIIEGDCRDVLRELPDQSVHCIVTSPPYFGLRDYGVDGQMGLEPTPDEFVEALVGVLREARRVLRDNGTLWLNLGDSYCTTPRGNRPGDMSTSSLTNPKRQDAVQSRVTDTKSKQQTNLGANFAGPNRLIKQEGIKHKDLIGIPWRVAFALQADGWYLRQDIIWHKPNPMPESVTDRCTKAHEYIFLLSKSPTYYFDSVAMQEPATGRPPGNKKPTKGGREYLEAEGEQHRTATNLHNIGARTTRNRRSVWTVTTKPFKEAHFATFPPDLIEPCVLAGCPVGGTVLDPFFGAGTTGLVADKHGRSCIGIELSPAYFDIASRRLGFEVDVPAVAAE